MAKLPYGGYTQKDWERKVGWSKVPPEYKHEESDNDVKQQDDKPTRDNSNND